METGAAAVLSPSEPVVDGMKAGSRAHLHRAPCCREAHTGLVCKLPNRLAESTGALLRSAVLIIINNDHVARAVLSSMAWCSVGVGSVWLKSHLIEQISAKHPPKSV